MNGYDLSRNFWDWCFENPNKIKPNHSALYFFAIEHCNRLGWKERFGFPTTMAMEAVGIRSYNTYIKTLNELVDFGFIIMVERSKNQHSSNIIELSKNDKALDKALDKAMIKHATKQSESTQQSNDSIDKQLTSKQKTKNKEQSFFSEKVFEVYESVVSLFPENTQPDTDSKKNNWLDVIRKLIELDGYEPEEIIFICDYFRKDSFWSGNFQSLTKLRELNKYKIKFIDYFKNQLHGKSINQNQLNKYDEIIRETKANGYRI